MILRGDFAHAVAAFRVGEIVGCTEQAESSVLDFAHPTKISLSPASRRHPMP
jgi:hypothetical protein